MQIVSSYATSLLFPLPDYHLVFFPRKVGTRSRYIGHIISGVTEWSSGFSAVVLWPTASVSPGNWLEMLILRAHPWPTESEIQKGWLSYTQKLEKHSPTRACQKCTTATPPQSCRIRMCTWSGRTCRRSAAHAAWGALLGPPAWPRLLPKLAPLQHTKAHAYSGNWGLSLNATQLPLGLSLGTLQQPSPSPFGPTNLCRRIVIMSLTKRTFTDELKSIIDSPLFYRSPKPPSLTEHPLSQWISVLVPYRTEISFKVCYQAVKEQQAQQLWFEKHFF